ncbi:Flp family type IVb pilin [Aurantiacibacter odishensis]|uniref:Flp family type IVb pilin n=1 Tax=Aurantiacibacter odishensis TaxID=1155476 RepID=UPI000E706FA4|nr:Flp family type IVb pilin [Aurantiacibacter odishensis]
MRNFINLFVRDESAASAAEYALILVIVGIAIVVGALALGESIGGAMSGAAACIDAGTSGACASF